MFLQLVEFDFYCLLVVGMKCHQYCFIQLLGFEELLMTILGINTKLIFIVAKKRLDVVFYHKQIFLVLGFVHDLLLQNSNGAFSIIELYESVNRTL